MVELDSLKETLENMVYFTETRFNDTINSLKANIFDIEHDDSIDVFITIEQPKLIRNIRV